jgi:hypothetical protein|tara:strand:+ start:3895 stop:4074 length:180 start_codon:yes stop_codon:yes gene_type:complete
MNALAHISALPACLWLSTFCFDTLSNQPLGTALLIVFLLLIPKTILAAWEDIDRYRGRE